MRRKIQSISSPSWKSIEVLSPKYMSYHTHLLLGEPDDILSSREYNIELQDKQKIGIAFSNQLPAQHLMLFDTYQENRPLDEKITCTYRYRGFIDHVYHCHQNIGITVT